MAHISRKRTWLLQRWFFQDYEHLSHYGEIQVEGRFVMHDINPYKNRRRRRRRRRMRRWNEDKMNIDFPTYFFDTQPQTSCVHDYPNNMKFNELQTSLPLHKHAYLILMPLNWNEKKTDKRWDAKISSISMRETEEYVVKWGREKKWGGDTERDMRGSRIPSRKCIVVLSVFKKKFKRGASSMEFFYL